MGHMALGTLPVPHIQRKEVENMSTVMTLFGRGVAFVNLDKRSANPGPKGMPGRCGVCLTFTIVSLSVTMLNNRAM